MEYELSLKMKTSAMRVHIGGGGTRLSPPLYRQYYLALSSPEPVDSGCSDRLAPYKRLVTLQ